MTQPIIWGLNMGQMEVKNVIGKTNGGYTICSPFPAVIAPWEKSDDTGLTGRKSQLEAVVRGVRYLGGRDAQYSPLAMRHMAEGRLNDDSPMYAALAQMSAQHIKLIKLHGTQPTVSIGTALPASWMNEEAQAAVEAHIRNGLNGITNVANVFVKSEPAAVILGEMIDDNGAIRTDQAALAKTLVCVADIGGSTMNHGVLDGLKPLAGRTDSPYLGSQTAIENYRKQAKLGQLADAEAALRAALEVPGTNPLADNVLRAYREAIVGTLEQAWKGLNPSTILVAGGTAIWVGDAIKKAFGPKVRIVKNPQQAIALGLWRFGKHLQNKRG